MVGAVYVGAQTTGVVDELVMAAGPTFAGDGMEVDVTALDEALVGNVLPDERVVDDDARRDVDPKLELCAVGVEETLDSEAKLSVLVSECVADERCSELELDKEITSTEEDVSVDGGELDTAPDPTDDAELSEEAARTRVRQLVYQCIAFKHAPADPLLACRSASLLCIAFLLCAYRASCIGAWSWPSWPVCHSAGSTESSVMPTMSCAPAGTLNGSAMAGSAPSTSLSAITPRSRFATGAYPRASSARCCCT